MILIVVVVATGGAGPPLDDSRRLLAVALSSAPHGVGVAGVILISCLAVADDRPGRESRGRPGGRKEGEDRGENNGDSWIMDGMRMHEHEGCLAGTAGTGRHA